MPEPIYALHHIGHTYRQGDIFLPILKDINLELHPGELIALMGPSGTGKSTLLHIAGLLETPTQGEVKVQGKVCSTLSDKERTSIRRYLLGFVYQFHHLLPEFNALENVMLPQLIQGVAQRAAQEKAVDLLSQVGLAHRHHHRPHQLSGGEQQRTAFARALANSPRILFADEPTGNLDEQTSEEVFQLLCHIVRSQKVAALIATHNMSLARKMDRILVLHEGQLSEQS